LHCGLSFPPADLKFISRLVSRPLALCGCAPPAYSDPAPTKAAAAPAVADEEAGGGPGAAAAPSPAPPPRRRGWALFGGAGRPPRRARTLRRALKVLSLQIMFLGQLPIVFGVLAPIVLVGSLGVWNFWVAIDLIVGAALLALLLVLCVVRRCGGGGDVWVD
jgi:hypothetical protein